MVRKSGAGADSNGPGSVGIFVTAKQVRLLSRLALTAGVFMCGHFRNIDRESLTNRSSQPLAVVKSHLIL
jgi:hypothetical protein